VKALFNGEKPFLLAINEDCDDDLIKVLAGSFDDIEVSISDGIKGSWTDCALHEGNASKLGVSYPFSAVISSGIP
jgi:hypothetical protein